MKRERIGKQIYLRLNPGDIVRNVNQGDDVDRKLPEDGADDVEVEDIWLRSFLGQTLDGLFVIL